MLKADDRKHKLINLIDDDILFLQSMKRERIKELPINLVINTFIKLKLKLISSYENEREYKK